MAGTEPSRERTKYLKRKQTLLKKIWELSTFCDVEVHVRFVHALETIIIDSTDDTHWPSDDEMEVCLPPTRPWTLVDTSSGKGGSPLQSLQPGITWTVPTRQGGRGRSN